MLAHRLLIRHLHFMRKKPGRAVFWGVGAATTLFLAWVIYMPIPFTALKIAALCSAVLLLLGVGVGFKHGKWFGLATLAIVAAFAFWPAQPTQPAELQTRYVAALSNYRGTRYVWGGENGRGIDCSGLIRRAMIDALLANGWERRDPASWREAALVWWRDCSANEMKIGYGGRIVPQFRAPSLNALDSKRLRPGDLAVLESGVHVLAFAGGRTWIQADPNLVNGGDKVIETTAPSRNGWFGQPVVICRWKSMG